MEEQDNSNCATHNKTNQIVLSIHSWTIQRYLIQPFADRGHFRYFVGERIIQKDQLEAELLHFL